uniref:Uncharacterized protein n=1 Tax=Avena sativa TaxID=4498 RepID=A0ACD5Y446_AVESA
MFSRGSSSSMANNKGKDIMEVEDGQEGNNGSAITNNKGKEIMVEAEEEQDGNNGSPWLQPTRELMEVAEALEWLQLQDVMADDDDDEEAAQEKEAPDWLKVLIRARFWRECRVHRHDKTLRRVKESVFCVHCFKVICPHCRHAEEEPTHRLLKIRHYVFRSVVSINDMKRLGVNVSHIQAYKCNGHEVVHLRPMRRSAGHKAPKETPRCLTCDCLLLTWPSRLCSLSCKIRKEAPTSDDDISGPGRTSHRLARRYAQGAATSRLPGTQGEATSRPVPAARRRSRRKQKNPRRAPFF